MVGHWDTVREERLETASDFIINSVMQTREMEVDVIILLLCVSTIDYFQYPNSPKNNAFFWRDTFYFLPKKLIFAGYLFYLSFFQKYL